MKEELEDKIMRYIDGSMSRDEVVVFEALLQQNKQLEEEVMSLKSLENDLKAAGLDAFKNTVKQWDNNYVQSQQKPSKFGWLAVAASIIVVFLLGYYFINDPAAQHEKLYAAYYAPYEDVILVRSEVITVPQLLATGMSAYDAGNYEQAIPSLEAFAKESQNDPAGALYLGICYLESGNYTAATGQFAIAAGEPVYAQQAQWYSALTALKSGALNDARDLLKLIAANQQHYKRVQAEELLDQI